MVTDIKVVSYMNYLVKMYDGITKLKAQVLQRLQSIPGEKIDDEYDPMLKGQKKEAGLNTVKGRISREIEKEIVLYDIWNEWLCRVPGIGAVTAAKLIIAWYYRFIPICKECGGDLQKKKDEKEEHNIFVCSQCGKKGKDGLLEHRLDLRDFPTISKWWAFMGRSVVDGKMPKRKKGIKANWSTANRTLGFHIGDQFNRHADDEPYKAFLLGQKRKHETKSPEISKGWRHNRARNEAVKLFLAHFWVVARTLEGKPVSQPYAGTIMGHTNIIEPFYWGDSQQKNETHLYFASPKPNRKKKAGAEAVV